MKIRRPAEIRKEAEEGGGDNGGENLGFTPYRKRKSPENFLLEIPIFLELLQQIFTEERHLSNLANDYYLTKLKASTLVRGHQIVFALTSLSDESNTNPAN